MNTTPSENRDDGFAQRQEAFRKKTYRIMLEVAIVFALPAVIAVVVGKRLDANMGTGSRWLMISLFIAFVFSWALVIRMYRALSVEAKHIDAEVKKIRDAEGKTKNASDDEEEKSSLIM